MPTITIRLDEETDTRLKRELAHSDISLSEFVREAVNSALSARPARETPYQAWLRLSKDCVSSGDADLSVTYKERIKERLRAKHRR
jgi:Arc/MetJ-type ribon-helix-helix transcriptional regulator